MGPSLPPSGACLQTVGVHGSASQPPSWACAAESKSRPLLSSSQPPSAPQMGRDRTMPACLLPQALLAPCQGPRGIAHSPAHSPGGHAGSGKGREPGPAPGPWAPSKQWFPPAQKLALERLGLSPTRCSLAPVLWPQSCPGHFGNPRWATVSVLSQSICSRQHGVSILGKFSSCMNLRKSLCASVSYL